MPFDVDKKHPAAMPSDVDTKTKMAKSISTANFYYHGPWDYFMSHKQNEAGRAVALITRDLEQRGKKVWLDVNMQDCSVAAMKEGVHNSHCFVCVLSDGYFESDFCRSEAQWAQAAGKQIILCHIEGINVGAALQSKPGGFDQIGHRASIQLVVSDPDFRQVSVQKLLEEAGEVSTKAAEERARRGREAETAAELEQGRAATKAAQHEAQAEKDEAKAVQKSAPEDNAGSVSPDANVPVVQGKQVAPEEKPAAEGNPGYVPHYKTPFVMTNGKHYARYVAGALWNVAWVDAASDATEFVVAKDASGVECFVTVLECDGIRRWVYSRGREMLSLVEMLIFEEGTVVESGANAARYYTRGMHLYDAPSKEEFVATGKLGASSFHMVRAGSVSSNAKAPVQGKQVAPEKPAAEGNPGYVPHYKTPFKMTKGGKHYAQYVAGCLWNVAWVDAASDATEFVVAKDASGVECFVTVLECDGARRWVYSNHPVAMLEIGYTFEEGTVVESGCNMARYYTHEMHLYDAPSKKEFMATGKLGASNFHMVRAGQPPPVLRSPLT